MRTFRCPVTGMVLEVPAVEVRSEVAQMAPDWLSHRLRSVVVLSVDAVMHGRYRAGAGYLRRLADDLDGIADHIDDLSAEALEEVAA